MDSLHLRDDERDLYAELFAGLDTENEGRVSVSSAIELISRCNLSADVIEKITELCGAKRLGHFGRSQFYIALKLIACAQNGISLNTDALANTNNVPLPVFSVSKDIEKQFYNKRNMTHQHSRDQHVNNKSASCQRTNSDSCHLPPPPPTKSNRQRFVSAKSVDYSSSPVPQTHISSKSLLKDNCEVAGFANEDNSSNSSSEARHSPLNEDFESRESWRLKNNIALKWDNCEEGHHLLGNDEDSEHAHSSNDEEENSDIWTITKEQKEYYLRQFNALGTDAEGKLSGRAAKHFFERSKLSQSVLSKIWKLSDVDKDGALSCEEFCTAMHLVVLRRNNVEIPDVLPLSSQCNNSDVVTSRKTPNDIPDSITLSPQNKEWTKFTDSPTNNIVVTSVTSPPNSRTSSSAGIMQPANFDFNAASIERDPKILHPVPLRISPDGHRVAYVTNEGPVSTMPSETYTGVSSLQPQYCTPRKDPPPPPPRPVKSRGHTRSSSLDLNRFSKAQINSTAVVEQQRIATNISPRLSSTTEHRGAFTIYRKCEPQIAAYNWLEVLKLKYPLPAVIPTLNDSDDRLDLLRTVKSLQQRNFYLESIYCDLIQELANALEMNSTLEAKIKQLVALK